VKVYVRH